MEKQESITITVQIGEREVWRRYAWDKDTDPQKIGEEVLEMMEVCSV